MMNAASSSSRPTLARAQGLALAAALSLSLTVALAAPSAIAQQQGKTYTELYQEARAAANAKNYALAEQKVVASLALKPTYPPSIALLHQLQQSTPKANIVASKYNNIEIPIMEFQEATVQSCLEYLKTQANTITGGPINFVYNLPADIANRRITLRLRKVPLVTALKYVTDQADCEYRLERYAVVFNPPNSTSVAEVDPVLIRPARASLRALTLPAVELQGLTVEQAYDDLRKLAHTASGGTEDPNIIIAMPKEELEGKVVNLSLKDIPFFEAVRLLTEHVGGEFKAGTYAITISAPTPPPAPPANTESSGTGTGTNLFEGTNSNTANKNGFPF